MKIVKTYLYSYEAHLDLAKLRNEEIEAVIRDDNIVSIDPILAHAVGGIKLFVNDDDYEKASEVLKINNYKALRDEFSPEQIEEQRECPNCGSTNVIRRNSILTGIFFYLLASVPVIKRTSKYICMNCSHKWKE